MTDTRTRLEMDYIIATNHMHRAYRRLVNRVLAAHGLSDSQALPILFLSRLGNGIRHGELAEHLGIEGPSLNRQIEQLCAQGLVERRADAKDGRARTLHLTKRGVEMADIINAIIAKMRGRVMAKISDRDLEAALRAAISLDQAVGSAIAETGDA